MFKFEAQELIEEFGEIEDGEEVGLELAGDLGVDLAGEAFSDFGWVKILKKGNKGEGSMGKGAPGDLAPLEGFNPAPWRVHLPHVPSILFK